MHAPVYGRLPSRLAAVWGGLDPSAILSATAQRALTAAVVALTLAASLIRSSELPLGQGTMGRDETRLAMAAYGILEHGYPLLPGGLFYTRGLLPSYLEAGSFALFGASDQSARLPSQVAGALLVPATYLLARGVLGGWASLAATAIIAFSPPLVARSNEAWLYSSFLLWFVLALACLHRSYRESGISARLLAAGSFVGAILSHEYAVLLIPIAFLADLVTRLRSRTRPTNRELIVFWSIVLTATAGVALMSMALRAPTVGGSMTEIRGYLQPHTDMRAAGMSVSLLATWHPWLLPAAALGVIAMIGVAPARRAGLAFVTLSLLVPMAFVYFVLGRAGHERDQLLLIPTLAVLAVAGVQAVGPWLIRAFSGIEPGRVAAGALAVGLVGVFVASTVKPAVFWEHAQHRSVPLTWVQNTAGFERGDLVMSYGPTVTSHYLGRTDFWLRANSFGKYVWAGRPPYRDVHSNAVVIRNMAEFQTYVLQPNAGRTLWIIWRPTETRDPRSPQNQILASLAPRLVYKQASPDGNVVMKAQL